MSRALLKLALPLLVCLTIPLLLIRAQPYDDPQLHTFLAPPDGCPPPCFMGVRLGETTVRAGRDQLARSDRIASIRMVSFQFYDVIFAADAPMHRARLYLISTPDVRVERINLFESGLPFSRFLLALGRPDQVNLYGTLRRNVVTIVAFYPRHWLYVLVNMPLCQLDQASLWDSQRKITMSIGLWREESELPDYFMAGRTLDVTAWAAQLRQLKRERCE